MEEGSKLGRVQDAFTSSLTPCSHLDERNALGAYRSFEGAWEPSDYLVWRIILRSEKKKGGEFM